MLISVQFFYIFQSGIPREAHNQNFSLLAHLDQKLQKLHFRNVHFLSLHGLIWHRASEFIWVFDMFFLSLQPTKENSNFWWGQHFIFWFYGKLFFQNLAVCLKNDEKLKMAPVATFYIYSIIFGGAESIPSIKKVIGWKIEK